MSYLKRTQNLRRIEYNSELEELIRFDAQLNNLIEEAIENKEFTINYQTKVLANNTNVIGAEALARWNSPIVGRVSPAVFVPKIEEMQKAEKLIISPLAYIRGRSLSNVFFIVDEAQNLTPHEVKTIITRAGEGTKMIFTGDIHQIDSPYLDLKSNGLSYLADRMKGQDIFAHVNLVKGERSYLAELASDLL